MSNSMDGYYRQQAQLPYFSGYQRQRGSGFGALALGVGKIAIPLLKKYGIPIAKRVGRELIQQAIPEVLDVVSKRKTPKQALKNTVRNTVRKQTGGAAIKARKRKSTFISAPTPAKRSRSKFFSKVQND